MDSLFALRGRLQELYAKRSVIIDKALQLVLALVTFYTINKNVGFMDAAASQVVTLALAVICTFFPPIMTVIAATLLILAHMFAVSLAALAVTALIFLVMYIFYFRLAPGTALIVLLTPIAFALRIPYVIPVAYGLIAGPTVLVAIGCGTVVYYMMMYVKGAAASMESEDSAGIVGQITAYIKQVFRNKEMWIALAALIISFLVVYAIHRLSVDHAWTIAIAAGAIVNVVVVAAGGIVLDVETSYAPLIGGCAAAVLIGLVLEFFFFSVDYSRSENLQYEDDDYYYYVKAVPKLAVASSEKTVKTINERQETEIIDAAEVRRRSRRQRVEEGRVSSRTELKRKKDMDEINKVLLEQSLREDLDDK